MQIGSIRSQRGLLRGALLLVLLAIIGLGAGWYWFFGRFRVPDKEPARPSGVVSVLDYAGRRDLGSDPLDAMVKPDLDAVTEGGVEAKLHLTRWSAAHLQAALGRAKWKAAGLLGDARPLGEYHVDYLHHAQRAEYWHARYVNALGD